MRETTWTPAGVHVAAAVDDELERQALIFTDIGEMLIVPLAASDAIRIGAALLDAEISADENLDLPLPELLDRIGRRLLERGRRERLQQSGAGQ